MELDSNIPEIDEQGIPKKVLTEYDVHTISLVDKGALGINFTKLKSEDQEKFLKSKEGQAIMSKINKAKELDKAENLDQVEGAQVEAASEDSVETNKAKSEVVSEYVKEDGAEPEQVEKAKSEEGPVEQPEEVAEDSEGVAPEEKEVASEGDTEAVEEESETNLEEDTDVEQEAKVEAEAEGEKSEKAKMYTVDEYLEASKSALDGMSKLVSEIKSKAPEADHWEVFDIVFKAVYDLEDASWCSDQAMWDKVWNEVWEQVSEKVQKSKSLKVSQAKTEEDKIKALEALDPSLAELVKSERAKSLKAEEERQAMVKAKAYEQAAHDYKRISSEDCSTNDIADAMLSIEQASPEDHKVIAKALENASRITMAGDLFEDKGTDAGDVTMSPEEYVESKAKSLAAKKDEQGESYNMAALRASVRSSAEYTALYA